MRVYNQERELLASAVRAASHNTDDQDNERHVGLILVINVTAASATPSVVFTIQGKCPVSGAYFTLLASAAVTGTGTTVLRIFPGSAVTSNLAANDQLPRTWRLSVAHADADSITYSVGAILLR